MCITLQQGVFSLSNVLLINVYWVWAQKLPLRLK